ncbi:MAG TPA: hypothetical protein VGK50_07700 [Coriobacteriia bacterium]|jgi:hypothetical protein
MLCTVPGGRTLQRRLFIVGPCGIGKTTLSSLIESRFGLPHLDFDQYRRAAPADSPACTLSRLDLPLCLAPFLAGHQDGYVIDFGGDTVFRRTVQDNDRRLQQIRQLKHEQGIEVALLDGNEDAVRSRFLSCKSRGPEEFDGPWKDWSEIGRPWWGQCADRVVDTTGARLEDETGMIALAETILG